MSGRSATNWKRLRQAAEKKLSDTSSTGTSSPNSPEIMTEDVRHARSESTSIDVHAYSIGSVSGARYFRSYALILAGFMRRVRLEIASPRCSAHEHRMREEDASCTVLCKKDCARVLRDSGPWPPVLSKRAGATTANRCRKVICRGQISHARASLCPRTGL